MYLKVKVTQRKGETLRCVPRFTSQIGMMAVIWPVQSEELLSLPLGCRSPTIALGHPLLLPRRISWDLDWNWSNYGTGECVE